MSDKTAERPGHTIASYLAKDTEDLIIFALEALASVLPGNHPLKQQALDYAAALQNDTWLCESFTAPDTEVH